MAWSDCTCMHMREMFPSFGGHSITLSISLVRIHSEVRTSVNVTPPKVVDFCKAVEYAIHVYLCQPSYGQKKVATVRSTSC